MSPFMSSMPAAGLIEMPPVSKQTPLPTKATGCSPRLPPFQRMITVRLGCVEPWPTPSSAPMPSLVIALTSSTSTSTPSLRNWLARRANSIGIQHVRRLVDEFAGEDHAIDDVVVGREGFARGADIADRDRNVGAQARHPRRPSFWSCSDRICRRAAACPTRSRRPAPASSRRQADRREPSRPRCRRAACRRSRRPI